MTWTPKTRTGERYVTPTQLGCQIGRRCPSASQCTQLLSCYWGAVFLSTYPLLPRSPFLETNIRPLLLTVMVLWVVALSSVAPSVDSVCGLNNVRKLLLCAWCRALSLTTTPWHVPNTSSPTDGLRESSSVHLASRVWKWRFGQYMSEDHCWQKRILRTMKKNTPSNFLVRPTHS